MHCEMLGSLSLFARAISSDVLNARSVQKSSAFPRCFSLPLLLDSEIKQQREKAPAPPASHRAQQNSIAVLWLLFAGGGGEELTEPWLHLPPPPPPPILHPQELGLPVVWQELYKHAPQSAFPCLPPLHALGKRGNTAAGNVEGDFHGIE